MGCVPCSAKDPEDAGKGLLLSRAVWLRGELWQWRQQPANPSVGALCARIQQVSATHNFFQRLCAHAAEHARVSAATARNNFLPSQAPGEAGPQRFILRGDPPGQVLRWHCAPSRSPWPASAAVPKPNSSSPSRAANDHVAAPISARHLPEPNCLSHPALMSVWCAFAKTKFPGHAGVLIELKGEAPVPPSKSA